MSALAPSRRAVHANGSTASRPNASVSPASSPCRRWSGSVRSGGGNFLFLEVDDPDALASKLSGLGIRVRFRPNAAPAECASPSAPRPKMKPRSPRSAWRPRPCRRGAPSSCATRRRPGSPSPSTSTAPRRGHRHRHPLLRSYARPGRGAWRLLADPLLRGRSRHRRPSQHRGLRHRLRSRAVAGARRPPRHRPLRLLAADGRDRGARPDRPFRPARQPSSRAVSRPAISAPIRPK